MHVQPGHHEHRPDPGTPMGTDPVCGIRARTATTRTEPRSSFVAPAAVTVKVCETKLVN